VWNIEQVTNESFINDPCIGRGRALGLLRLLSNEYSEFFLWGENGQSVDGLHNDAVSSSDYIASVPEVDHSLSFSAKVRNAWSYTATDQCVFMVWCLKNHRDNSIFFL
jgi:hypothetical protein